MITKVHSEGKNAGNASTAIINIVKIKRIPSPSSTSKKSPPTPMTSTEENSNLPWGYLEAKPSAKQTKIKD